MDRREQILWAALELATEKGLNAVSMSQIAERVGIQKPSLYNHFRSKEEMISSVYELVRGQAKERVQAVDFGELAKNHSAEEVLTIAVTNYFNMTRSEKLFSFYKLIYAERAIHAEAAKILTEETNRMVLATKQIFYALQVHGKIRVNDVDAAALSFAMTVHAMMDYALDCASASVPYDEKALENYIHWFCALIGG